MHDLIEFIAEKNKFPIFILSSPRSGGAVLMDYIAFMYPHLEIFNEPDRSKLEMDRFIRCTMHTNNYIVKAQASRIYSDSDNIVRYPDEIKRRLTNDPDVFRISTTRGNLILQIASYYIADIRKIWSYNASSAMKTKIKEIKIDTKLIDSAIASVRYSLSYKCPEVDYTISYEEIQNKYITGNMLRTPYPLNYAELLSFIRDRYKTLHGT